MLVVRDEAPLVTVRALITCLRKSVRGPSGWLRFIQLTRFERAWRSLGLADVDLRALETEIRAASRSAPVMKGCGGFRKLTFAPPTWSTGKRGSLRVLFLHVEPRGVVFLFTAYRKNVREDLTSEERRALAALAEACARLLDDGVEGPRE